MKDLYFHPHQLDDEHESNRPNGHEVLKSLVPSYGTLSYTQGEICEVGLSDSINGCFGLIEITQIRSSWITVPGEFKSWSRTRLLYAWRDVVWDQLGNLNVPALGNVPQKPPSIQWLRLDSNTWDENDPALRSQRVIPQG